MSREFYEGFETRDFSLWDGVIGAPAIVSGISGMTGYCLLRSVQQYVWRTQPALQERYYAFKWRSAAWIATEQSMFHFYYNTTRLISVIAARRGIAGTPYYLTVQTSANTYPAWSDLPIRWNTTYSVEVYHKVHPTDGVITVKIDGVEWITYSGNTSSGNITVCNRINLANMGSYDHAYYDDIITDNENWIGLTSLGFMKTNAAGDLVGWTPSSEPPYGCLNETPISMERFLTASAPAQTLFNYTDPPGLGANVVKGLQVMTMGTLTGFPTAAYLRMLVKSNGLLDRGDRGQLPSVLNPTYRMMLVNPTTGVPWTELDLVDLQLGLEAEV